MSLILQLKELVALTEMVFQQEQSKMAALARREADLRDLIGQVTSHGRTNSALATEDIAASALRNERWQIWAEQRKVALNRELARVLAMEDAQKTPLAAAFGKHHAMLELLKTVQSAGKKSGH